MVKKNKPKRVNRTLYCFHLRFETNTNHIFTWENMFSHFTYRNMENLKYQGDDSLLLLIVESVTNDRVRGHFNRLRYEHPLIMDMATWGDDTISLTPDQNLMERAHFIYYPNTNVLVAEYNHYGTRAFGRFGRYVEDCIPQIKKVELLPYIRKDTVGEASRKKGRFKKYELTIAPPALPVIEEAFGLGVTETLRGTAGEEIDTNISIKISMSAGRRSLPYATQNRIAAFIEKFRNLDNRAGITKAKVTADKVVDLFGGEYFHKVSVLSLQENSRVVISEDMYNELDKFYNDHVRKELSGLTIRG